MTSAFCRVPFVIGCASAGARFALSSLEGSKEEVIADFKREESFALITACGFEIRVLLLNGSVFCDPREAGPLEDRPVLRAGGIVAVTVWILISEWLLLGRDVVVGVGNQCCIGLGERDVVLVDDAVEG